MTNPNNSLGTNGAFGGRTSVNAFNDVLATFDGAGIVSGFVVEPDSGMTVAVGGDGTTRDVAVAEDPFGNRTTVDNITGDPIPVTIDTASTTTARIDSIVAYVNSPANASDTSVDNPTACGIISVNGTSGGAPTDAAIRTAITADGGTGSTAYYVVIADVSVPANTTTITGGLISAGKSINLSNTVTTGSNGLMLAADKTALNNINATYGINITSSIDRNTSYTSTLQAVRIANLVVMSFDFQNGGATGDLNLCTIPSEVRPAENRFAAVSFLNTNGGYSHAGYALIGSGGAIQIRSFASGDGRARASIFWSF